jgi:signal transduction histidine kinase
VVDRPQLESALVNLGLNARDALATGGTVTIATRRSGPGEMELSVADDGCGMDETTRERAIDPFFTTKEVGQGTGLGLSQVVGTVEQMGGRVALESAPGTGTTVRLFLPLDEEG